MSADLYNNDVLVMKECKKFKFFKIVKINQLENQVEKFQLKLELYHTIKISGFMSFGAGQDHFRIVSDKFIYTYQMDPSSVDYIPEHISTMFNFVGCTSMFID